ncbi:MAG: long-chain fatty acid--CoA ligase, partial [Aeromicrobium sp.]
GTHLKITDRMKDIIITAGGKNISPSMIENDLKASPYIREAIVCGDGRKFLCCLIGIELDTVGEWAQRRQIGYSTYRDLSEKEEVLELVAGIVNDVNSRLASVEQVKQFRLLAKELDHEDGELTATQKVKRSAIATMFEDTVEDMYAGSKR